MSIHPKDEPRRGQGEAAAERAAYARRIDCAGEPHPQARSDMRAARGRGMRDGERWHPAAQDDARG